MDLSLLRVWVSLALVAATGSAAAAGGQGVDEVLVATIGSEAGEVATSVLELPGGDLVVAGYTYADWDSPWDALVLRVAPDGREIWRRTAPRPGADHAWSVRSAAEGRFVVAGTLTTENGDTDGWLRELDGDGRERWSRTYGGPGDEVLWAAEPVGDGGYLLVGQTDSEGAGGLDFYVVRTDARGQVLWTRTAGTAQTDRALAVGITPDGGALVAGFQGPDRETMTTVVVRLGPDGEELWRQSAGGARFDVAHDVVVLPDGGFLVSGYTSSFGPGDQDGLLMRLGADGKLLWTKTYDGGGEDRFLHLAPSLDGGFVMVGYATREPAADPNATPWGLVVRRVDADGDPLWLYRWGEGGFDPGKDVVAAKDGSFIVVGATRSTHPPYEDILLIRLRDGEISR